jgi:AP-2 complex subunit alpha
MITSFYTDRLLLSLRYLALESFARLALLPDILVAIRHHQPTVLASLRDPDISIRKKAMDLLFTMCDANNAPDLVGELLAYLVSRTS